MLINDLADIDNEVFLFLDDYHSVPDSAIRGAVSFLLRYAPSHLHLALTMRLGPPLSLGGLLAENRLLEVDASVLRALYQRDQQSEKRVSLVFLLYQKGRGLPHRLLLDFDTGAHLLGLDETPPKTRYEPD